MSESIFEPRILAYCCKYCAYAAADLAGSMRLAYPGNIRLFENYLFYPISVLSEEFNPQNTRCIPPVKFFFRLELEQTKQFSNSL
jgi:hypothetical protein